MRATTPPATLASDDPTKSQSVIKSSLLMMGFPSRIVDRAPTLCACHSRPTRGGYLCSRCSSKVCSLPTTCPACKLTLILSTHLARSYHHLFPLQNWTEVSWQRANRSNQRACFGCQSPFPTKRSTGAQNTPTLLTNNRTTAKKSHHPKSLDGGIPSSANKDRTSSSSATAAVAGAAGAEHVVADGVSESGRYECSTCHRFFCIDCDVFAHEIVHNCPGCQSREGALLLQKADEEGGEAEEEKKK